MNRRAMVQLIGMRIRQFFREPEAIFWTYGFPLIMVLVLGLAFRNKPEEVVEFETVEGVSASHVEAALKDNDHFKFAVHTESQAMERLHKNKTPIVVMFTEDAGYTYHFDPTNPGSRAARAAIDDALQRSAGRMDPVATEDEEVTAPGSRYIDFLVPGLIGMNLMGGGLWGIGFVLVDMRVRNLLKRLLATPMRRSDFLLSMIGVRVLFFIPEMFFLLFVAALIFEIPIRGSLLSVAFLAWIGSMSFAGLGLLVACRAKRLETVTGLMNLVMLPMWLTSGVFFSSERFPDFLQPFIRALPLTQLNDALRAIILDGAGLWTQTGPMLILLAWGSVSFLLALKWFRWNE